MQSLIFVSLDDDCQIREQLQLKLLISKVKIYNRIFDKNVAISLIFMNLY